MAHSWPKRRSDEWLNQAERLQRREKRVRKCCRSEEFVVGRRPARLGLSRRRSRVPVPSLPFRMSPLSRLFLMVGRLRKALRESVGTALGTRTNAPKTQMSQSLLLGELDLPTDFPFVEFMSAELEFRARVGTSPIDPSRKWAEFGPAWIAVAYRSWT